MQPHEPSPQILSPAGTCRCGHPPVRSRTAFGLENNVQLKCAAVRTDGDENGDRLLDTSTLLVLNTLPLASDHLTHLGKFRGHVCFVHPIHIFGSDPRNHNFLLNNVLPTVDVCQIDSAGTIARKVLGPVSVNLVLVPVNESVNPALSNTFVTPSPAPQDFVRNLFDLVMREGESTMALVDHCMNEDVLFLRRELLPALACLCLCDVGVLDVAGEGISVDTVYQREIPQ